MPLGRFLTTDATEPRLGLVVDDRIIPLDTSGGPGDIHAALQLPASDLAAAIEQARSADGAGMPLGEVELVAPIDVQEVWACGVTYRRSRDARMEESTQQDVYDRVYDADRPELFLKATASRVSGPGREIAIRGDSTWDVPEPELVLVINRHGEVVGYTVGNDVSSRSIEGENPLYLPQAKVYTACAGLGPWIVLADEVPDPTALTIQLVIERDGALFFDGETSTREIHRPLDQLVEYLHRYNAYPDGVFLMTGTGIVPPAEFTLEHGDRVSITIDRIGTLTNPVVRL
ncbi:MAG TPA: fumarylacetoacetate hydrolase family protein [Thermomicrobiales bacterium]|nr:fumarylacetoacetate hydrolase family protein [Thermomicrobiales bacterium]